MNKRISFTILLVSAGMFQTADALERTRLGLVKEGEFSLLTGLDYKQGDYGTADETSSWRVPINLTYRKTNFSLFASIPLLYASSEGDIIIDNKTAMSKKGVLPPSTSTETNTASGIGDIVFSGSYYPEPDFRNEISYRLTATVKFGTADAAAGLGTGEDDFFFEGGVVKHIDEYALSGTLGYEISGDSALFEYNDVFYGTAGLIRQLRMNKQVGTYLYFSQAHTDTSDAPLELSVFYSQPVAETRDIYLYMSKGLSDASPDFSLGANIQFYY